MISRYGPLFFVVLLGSVGAPAHVRGQPTSKIGGGLALGLTPNLAEGFSNDQICKKRSGVSLSGRVTVALTKVIQLEALAETFKGPPSSCVSAPSPPVPPSGPYTQIADFYEERITDPPTVLALRVGGSLPKTGTHLLRPYVGIARFSGEGITTPLAGISILRGGSPQRVLFEIEGWWYSVPKRHLEEEFFDGELVRRSLTERGVRTFTLVFRIGFTSIVGRG